ncbi:murein transglycosylase A [Uliginosibacterium sp. H3]|uniref:peptidoglycan lytic exotransglycosylase n=1 Tax=Uliginosibacterium silvisoli TaxID=3114758 RepID=A0ABU6JZC0_9RHOO|nr:murein transglycosylase A [Uliginosibacterium sp. H3]
MTHKPSSITAPALNPFKQDRQYRPAATALLCAALGALLAACSTTTPAPVREQEPTPAANCPAPVLPAPVVCPGPEPKPPVQPPAAPWRSADWSALPGWQQDKPAQAWPALLASCKALRSDMLKAWSATCDAARELGPQASDAAVRQFLQARLTPWQLINVDGSETGLITGYYAPLIQASRTQTDRFRTPVLGVPDDLITVDLGELYPELKGKRVRGRLDGHKLVPYWSNGQLAAITDPQQLPSKPLMWVEDSIEFMFLQIQGSGFAKFSDGSRVRIAYADQNGHPYKSIGRWLIDRGELTLDKASMQGIQAWARANPKRLLELISANPSYTFFREDVSSGDGVQGAQGVELTAMRSTAVDPRTIPLGAPMFLSFNMPDGKPMQRLMLAQDTGGAITGRVRADFYWGFGAEAGSQAGRMRQQGRIWILWPQGSTPPTATP